LTFDSQEKVDSAIPGSTGDIILATALRVGGLVDPKIDESVGHFFIRPLLKRFMKIKILVEAKSRRGKELEDKYSAT
jgi:hypothetical protein